MDSSNLILLMLAISAFILGTAALQPWERLSEEEEMKPDLQLRIINKPAVKSFQSEVLEYRGVQYGAKVNINVWSPSVSEDQLSTATVWIIEVVSPQVTNIQAGWIVYQYLYKNYSRPYIYWTDNATGNWSNVGASVSYTACPGQVYGPPGEASSAMGSGPFSEENFKKSAFMNQLKVADESHSFVDPNQLAFNLDKPGCYNIDYYVDPDPNWKTIYYGSLEIVQTDHLVELQALLCGF